MRAAWLQWKVVFFRARRITREQQIAFGKQVFDNLDNLGNQAVASAG